MLPVGVRTNATEDAPAVAPVTARRVLVVDDNADSAMSLSVLLEMEGHEVRAAGNGLAAMRELEQFDAQVVLLDLGLPGLDGYATADLIRQRCGTAAPYLVALSGYGPPPGGGFDAYLSKPLELPQLREILLRLPASQPRELSR